MTVTPLVLLFVGKQYRKAIERYYYATPGPTKMLPLSVDELLQDDRFPKPQRHLRKPYPDPMSGDGSWGVLRQGSRIVGFYSLSDQKPLKKSGFDSRYCEFSAAQSLREWRFMFKEPAAKSADNSPGIPIATFPKAATSGNPAISSFPFN